jgi:hypothetical protein
MIIAQHLFGKHTFFLISDSNQDSPSAYFIKARNAAGYEPNSDICTNLDFTLSCGGVGWTSIGAFQHQIMLASTTHFAIR